MGHYLAKFNDPPCIKMQDLRFKEDTKCVAQNVSVAAMLH